MGIQQPHYSQDGGMGQNQACVGNCLFWHLQSDVFKSPQYQIQISLEVSPSPKAGMEKHNFPIKCQGHPCVLWQSRVEKFHSTCLHVFGPVPSFHFPSDQKHIRLQLFKKQNNQVPASLLLFCKASSRPYSKLWLILHYDILSNLSFQISTRENS